MIAIYPLIHRMISVLAALCLSFTLLPVGVYAESPPITIHNPGFEEPVSGKAIPGWKQTFGVGYSDVTYEVSAALSYEGGYSLLLDDRNSVRALGLESDPFPVVPGVSYSLTAMMKVENGSMGLYLRFFNAAGTKIGESVNWLTPTNGEWAKNGTSSVIPADAVSATVLLYSSGAGITRGYADDVQIQEIEMGTYERIGGVVHGMINADSEVSVEDGKPVIYSVFKGRDAVPTVFAVIDALTRDVLRTYPLPGVESAWGVKAATDGRVYIGTHYDGGLYRYTPGSLNFEYLGRFGSETHVFSMTAGPDGKMFAGTYPGGRLYEFDPALEKIIDLGAVDPEQKYVRSLAYDAARDVLYAGAGGSKSRIYKISPDGTRKELLGTMIPGGGDTVAFPYGMDFAEDRLFVKFSNGDLLVVRPDDTIDYYDPDGMDIHSGQVAAIPGQPGRVVFTLSGQLYVYDSATQSSSLLKEIESTINFHDGKFVDLGSPEWPGMTFVGMGSFGHVMYYNLSTGRTEVTPANYAGSPILIQSIHAGPDNKMYVAGYMSGFASYDPVSGAVSETNSLGQIESSVVRNGKLILGAYAGSRILEYDPSQPFSESNPHQLFALREHGQDRPFAMAYDPVSDQLAVGTVANTTSLQGALSIYDFATQTVDVYKNIVPNQSIISLAYKDGLVYAGTTVYGGLGTSGPTETNAKLFIFDPLTKQKVYETTPAIGRKGVTGLSVGPDGMIWGVAEDFIFKFNPATRQFDYRVAKLRRYAANTTTWAWAFLHPGTDGNMYGTSRGQFFMMKPETNEFVILDGSRGNYLNRDAFGNFYFSDSSDLWKYTPPGLDNEPPTTTTAVDPVSPDGNNGWYTGPVTVALSATDERVGVVETVYSTDSGAKWSPYTVPLRFELDGAYTLLYKSTDAAGNTESMGSMSFKLDTSDPDITVNIPAEATYYTADEITLGISVTDSGSGIDPVTTKVSLDGQEVQQDAAIQLYKLPLGSHTVTVTSSDLAGNTKSNSIVFHTAPAQESLIRLVERFAAKGWIDNDGIVNSLLVKLKEGNLQSFIQQVKAQSGEHIHQEAADYLLRDAEELLR